MTHTQPLALQNKVFLWPRPLDSLSYTSLCMLLRGTSWAKSNLEQMGADRKPALTTPTPEMLSSQCAEQLPIKNIKAVITDLDCLKLKMRTLVSPCP